MLTISIPILSQPLTTLFGQFNMGLASSPQRLDLTLLALLLREEYLQMGSGHQHRGHITRTTDLGKLDALRLHRPNGLGASMEERLCHRWLVRALRPSIEPEVRGLERHLDKRIGGEPVLDDPVAAVPLELERLAVVLANQVRDARLGEPNAGAQLGGELPLEFPRRSVEDLWRLLVGVAVVP